MTRHTHHPPASGAAGLPPAQGGWRQPLGVSWGCALRPSQITAIRKPRELKGRAIPAHGPAEGAPGEWPPWPSGLALAAPVAASCYLLHTCGASSARLQRLTPARGQAGYCGTITGTTAPPTARSLETSKSRYILYFDYHVECDYHIERT